MQGTGAQEVSWRLIVAKVPDAMGRWRSCRFPEVSLIPRSRPQAHMPKACEVASRRAVQYTIEKEQHYKYTAVRGIRITVYCVETTLCHRLLVQARPGVACRATTALRAKIQAAFVKASMFLMPPTPSADEDTTAQASQQCRLRRLRPRLGQRFRHPRPRSVGGSSSVA